MTATLGVSTFSVFNIASPILTIVAAFLGIRMLTRKASDLS